VTQPSLQSFTDFHCIRGHLSLDCILLVFFERECKTLWWFPLLINRIKEYLFILEIVNDSFFLVMHIHIVQGLLWVSRVNYHFLNLHSGIVILSVNSPKHLHNNKLTIHMILLCNCVLPSIWVLWRNVLDLSSLSLDRSEGCWEHLTFYYSHSPLITNLN
jgi:hypothetical protein